MHRLIIRAGIFAAALLFGAAAAQAQAVWTANQFTDENGTRVGVLNYGVPETDDSTLYVLCSADRPDVAEMNLFINPGPNGVGQEVTVTFTSAQLAPTTRTATIVDSGLVGPYPQVLLWTTDALWQNFAHDNWISFAVQGQPYVNVSLAGSSGAVNQWLQICNSFAGGPGNAAAPQAPANSACGRRTAGWPALRRRCRPGSRLRQLERYRRDGAHCGGHGADEPQRQQLCLGYGTHRGRHLPRPGHHRVGAEGAAHADHGRCHRVSKPQSGRQSRHPLTALVERQRGRLGSAQCARHLRSGPAHQRLRADQLQRCRRLGLARISSAHPARRWRRGDRTNHAGAGRSRRGRSSAESNAGGNPSIDALYIGTWQQVVSKGACSANCVLTVNRNGDALSVYSSSGWQADVYWGADGDQLYATGTGAWTNGPNAGGAVYVDLVASADGSTLQAMVSIFDGPPQTFNFVRQ